MRADRRALLDDDDREFGIELLQPDRGGEARRSGADDDDVVVHRLAGGQFGSRRTSFLLVAWVDRREQNAPGAKTQALI